MGGVVVGIEASGIALGFRQDLPDGTRQELLVRIAWDGASDPLGQDPLPGVYHFLQGQDREGWHRDVPSFSSIVWPSAFPGVDLKVRGDSNGLGFEFECAPGVDASAVRLRCEGVSSLIIGAQGDAQLGTEFGSLRWQQPVLQSDRTDSALSWRGLEAEGQDRLELGPFPGGLDSSQIVTSGILWGLVIGGSNLDDLRGVELTDSGDVVVSGWTFSIDYPTTPGVLFETHPSAATTASTAFVTRLNGQNGSLVYSTFFGGSTSTTPYCMTLDEQGGAVIGGSSGGIDDLPVTPGAYATTLSGLSDAFVARLSPQGDDVVFCTYLGGSDFLASEECHGIYIEPDGTITVVGRATGSDFPTTPGAFDPTPNDSFDGFVTRFTPDGSGLQFSTMLRGGTAVVVDEPTGEVIVAGGSYETDHPVTHGAFQTTFLNTSSHAFVTRFTADGSGLVYSTVLGGLKHDRAQDLALAPNGDVIVVGHTQSADFPITANAYSPLINLTGSTSFGIEDVFISRLSADGSELPYSTFLGGAGIENLDVALHLDSAGAITVTGRTSSPGSFPTTAGALSSSNAGAFDGFVTRLHPSGQSLMYSTYFGGQGDDNWPVGLAVSPEGLAVVAGTTRSFNLPTTIPNPLGVGTTPNIFIGVFTMLPSGVDRIGTSSHGCNGALALGASDWPQIGNASFALSSTNGPANAMGLLMFSSNVLPQPLIVGGALVWPDPTAALTLLPVSSNDVGFAEVPLRMPADATLAGLTVFTQFLWPNNCPPNTVATTAAARIVVQAP